MSAAAYAISPVPRILVGYEAVLAATTPDKSSADIARELRLSPGYVRKVWARKGLPRRGGGRRPRCSTAEAEPSG